jgi:hypothetical protein
MRDAATLADHDRAPGCDALALMVAPVKKSAPQFTHAHLPLVFAQFIFLLAREIEFLPRVLD